MASRKDTKHPVISTHTPLARRDQAVQDANAALTNFYSHASCEARPKILKHYYTREIFLLTRLLRGATNLKIELIYQYIISTHTPLARRDQFRMRICEWLSYFYSHASCEARL